MKKIIIRLLSALTKEIKIGFKRLAVICIIGLIGFSNYGYGSVNGEDRDGWTPLFYSVINGNYEASKSLIYDGADVNARDNTGATAFHYAAFLGKSKIAKLLIDSGSNFKSLDNDKWTPWHYATVRNKIKSILSIIKRKAPGTLEGKKVCQP